MVGFNHATKSVSIKLVYYGPGLCGKTTNLQWIHDHVKFKEKGKLLSLATESERTLLFDFLPVELGSIRGYYTRVQLYTVPGQVFYDATRRMVLKDADAVVFVADSQEAMLEANLESLQNLRENLAANALDPELPLVFQYNKRDLPTALPVATLDARLNPRNLPRFEAVAIRGTGVEETLKGITRVLFKSLADLYGAKPAASSPSSVARAAAAPTTKATAPSLPAVGPSRPQAPAAGATRAPASATAGLALAQSDVPAREAAPGDTLVRPPGDAAASAPPWFYLHERKQQGPIEFDDLVDLILSSLREDTKVWRPGLKDWVPANRIPEIADEIPPPLPFAGGGEDDFPDFNTVPAALRTALIADDDEGFRRLLALPLAAQGFRVFEAVDGAEAWRLALEHRPWLMLAEIDLIEVDGFEFCRRVRSNSLLSHTPVVFLSASDKFKDRSRAQQVGADEFLSKRTPIRELLIRIQLLLTRYSELSASGQGSGSAAAGLLEGRIEVFGAPGVLQICNQSRLTGLFSARTKDPESSAERTAIMGFRDGEIVSAAVHDLRDERAVYAFLSWPQGFFRFVPGDPGSTPPLAETVEHLLLEGCRLLDEAKREAGTA